MAVCMRFVVHRWRWQIEVHVAVVIWDLAGVEHKLIVGIALHHHHVRGQHRRWDLHDGWLLELHGAAMWRHGSTPAI